MTRKWDYNFHSHTYRCGHAEGQDEEFVLAAIKAGFKTMGFSDHVFLPGIHEPRMRGDYELLQEYLHSVDVLRRRYEGVIDIYKGFEAEYCPEFEPYYRDLLNNKGVEFLLLGQHSFYKEGKMHWYTTGAEKEEAIRNYTRDLIKGMESGLFLYCNHPDFFLIYYHEWNKVCEDCAREIAKASKRLGMPLEVNMAHSRLALPSETGETTYPYPAFWRIVAEEGCDVTLGVDAHRPMEYQITRYSLFLQFIEENNLHLVTPKVTHK